MDLQKNINAKEKKKKNRISQQMVNAVVPRTKI